MRITKEEGLQNLARLIDLVERAHPKKFNLHYFVGGQLNPKEMVKNLEEVGTCGTTACFFGFSPLVTDLMEWTDRGDLIPTGEPTSPRIWTRIAEAFGITPDEALYIGKPRAFPDSDDDTAKRHNSKEATIERAKLVLRTNLASLADKNWTHYE